MTLTARDNTAAALRAYQQNMSNSERATREMGATAQRTGLDMDRMATAIKAAIVGIGLMRVKDFAEDFNELGVKVNATRRIFNALTDDIGGPTQALVMMREATLGAVDDLTLMGGANQFLRMNVATTAEELAQLTEIAIKLKRPTVDATTAVQDFAMLLSQQSILRLDNFGFSSGRVRDRIQELQEEMQGLSRTDAFRLAVLEEGEKALDRLGDAADVAGTAVGRLQTAIENFAQQAASNFATGVEGMAGIFEIAIGTSPHLATRDEARMKEAGLMAAAALEQGFISNVDPEFLTQFFFEDLSLSLRQQGANYGDMLRAQASVALFGGPQQHNLRVDEFESLYNRRDALRGYAQQALAVQRIEEQSLRLAEEALERQRATEESVRQEAVQQERNAQARQATGDFFALEAQLGQSGLAPRGFTGLEDAQLPPFLRREAADNMTLMADEAGRILEEMERLDELDDALFSDPELEQMKSVADETERLAKEADKAADAFDKIKLSDVFGQTGGGISGEVGDIVAGQLEAAGASEEQIAAFMREMDLASGRETAGSLALQEQIAPMIADIAQREGPELAAIAARNLGAVLSEAALRGINTNSPEFISALANALGVQEAGPGVPFTVAPFQMGSGMTPLQTNLEQTPDAMAAYFKEQFGVDLAPGVFANVVSGLDTTINPDEIRPQIENALATQMLSEINKGGFTLITKDELVGSPAFQEAVNEAVVNTVASLTSETTTMNAGGGTLSGIQAQLAAQGVNVTLDQLLAATGAGSPNLVQPGTYDLGGFEQVEGFDPETFLTGFENLSGQSDNIQTAMSSILTNISEAQQPVGLVESAMNNISTYADAFASRIKELTSKVQRVKVELQVEVSGDGSEWLAGQVRANGGTVPGAIP